MTPVLEIAFVNNMPDAALATTHAQFSGLLRAGAGKRNLRMRCYTLPGHDRGAAARRFLAGAYEGVDALYRRGADALIVTGCDPRAAWLPDESYWPHLARLVDWARDHTSSAIWSCLAAHAATHHLAGIERRPAPQKISGVYRFACAETEWIDRPATEILVPHSRYNGLPRAELEQEGFRIASFSMEAGVDMFWREEPSLFVFLQGHPEYDADTLLKAYRRDVARFLEGHRLDFPLLPGNFFSEENAGRLEALKTRVLAGTQEKAIGALGEILASQKYDQPWAADARVFFHNWLNAVCARASAHRRSA
jgi:homoserine O-succinyltransferase/O-acetyltransferase